MQQSVFKISSFVPNFMNIGLENIDLPASQRFQPVLKIFQTLLVQFRTFEDISNIIGLILHF